MARLIKIADWSGGKRGNVVFVHGLGGHPYDTWRRAPNDGTFWPLWLAEDVKGVSVYSLGYISPATNWLGTAMPLLDEAANILRLLLNETELRDGPIAFICHSLGGLIVKQILRAANEQRSNPAAADLVARTREVVFIATPHTGSGKATLMETLGFLVWGSDSARDLVANKPELRDLNFGYREFVKTRGDQISHLSFYEMVNTPLGRIVQPDSADPGLPNCTPTPFREDHVTIAKPRRRDELLYVETRNFVAKLAPEPASPGLLRSYPLEPFTLEWSWSQLVPKLVRIAAIGLVIAAIWLGIPRLHRLASTIVETRTEVAETRSKIDDTQAKVDQILLRISKTEGVPLETLRAILAAMGTVATTADQAEISRLLTAKAAEFNALTERLNRLSDADPEVARLRLAAADALKRGQFAEADSSLAGAEARDLAGLGDLEAIARQKRLSAAETRAQRASAAMLRANPDAYLEAAAHYAEAARIAQVVDPKTALRYTIDRGQSLMALGADFGRNESLQQAIDLFRATQAQLNPAPDTDDEAWVRTNLGNALVALGQREAGTEKLKEAIAAQREALKGRPRERVPYYWAMTQYNLGNALWALGQRESGTEKLDEAVTAYREALKEMTIEHNPYDWASAQSNLALALWQLGQRESGTEKLDQAAAAFREAQKALTRERYPLEWALTQNNLGNVLWTLGTRETDPEKFHEAIIAFREALKERTRERVPLDWAATQNNIGNTLVALAQREGGTTGLKEAIAAYREALKEITRDRYHLGWATVQNNLGTALWSLGISERDTGKFDEAVAAYRDALTERTRDRVPLDWAATQFNLGNALLSLGESENGTEKIDQAVAAYRAALSVTSREQAPLAWAKMLGNLGQALATIDQRNNDTAILTEAIANYRQALQEATREHAPLDWATIQYNLGAALYALGSRQTGTQTLQEAAEAFRATLQERTRERDPLNWAKAQAFLGAALCTIGQSGEGTSQLDEAIAAFREASKELTPATTTREYEALQKSMAWCTELIQQGRKPL
jgi:tetratricopeptide (TPR) repeat protein/pimeloyl-ACP methyl ester carboxylesterase